MRINFFSQTVIFSLFSSSNMPSFRMASYRSKLSSTRRYVLHRIHLGFGGKSHSSGSKPPIEQRADLIFACRNGPVRRDSGIAKHRQPVAPIYVERQKIVHLAASIKLRLHGAYRGKRNTIVGRQSDATGLSD